MNVTLLRRASVLLGLTALLVLIAAPIMMKAQGAYGAYRGVQAAQFTQNEFAARMERLEGEWSATNAETGWIPILAASEDEALASVRSRSDQVNWQVQTPGLLVGEIQRQGMETDMWRALIEIGTLFPEAELEHLEAVALGDGRVQLQMRLRLAWRSR